MEDFARQTIDQTIKLTEQIIASRDVSWPVARKGVLRVATTLSRDYPGSALGIRRALKRYVMEREASAISIRS